MDGNIYNPIQAGQAQTGMNSGLAANYDFNQNYGLNSNANDMAQYGIDPSLTTNVGQSGSWFENMMSPGSMGKGGFMSSLPGYAISAFSAYDQNKTNKLNREATQYAMDRKKTEDKAYDKYKSDWSKMSFA